MLDQLCISCPSNPDMLLLLHLSYCLLWYDVMTMHVLVA